MSSGIVGLFAGLLLAIAGIVGGFGGFAFAVVLGGLGLVLGLHRDGVVDLSTLLRSGRRG